MPTAEDAIRVMIEHYLVCPDLDKQRKAGPNAKYAVDDIRRWARTLKSEKDRLLYMEVE